MIRMIRQSVFFLELIKMEVAQPFKLRFQKGHDSESDLNLAVLSYYLTS